MGLETKMSDKAPSGEARDATGRRTSIRQGEGGGQAEEAALARLQSASATLAGIRASEGCTGAHLTEKCQAAPGALEKAMGKEKEQRTGTQRSTLRRNRPAM